MVQVLSRRIQSEMRSVSRMSYLFRQLVCIILCHQTALRNRRPVLVVNLFMLFRQRDTHSFNELVCTTQSR